MRIINTLVGFAIIFACLETPTNAQTSLNSNIEISLYTVLIKTKTDRVTGILQKVDSASVVVINEDGITTVNPNVIKYIRVRFDRKKKVNVFTDIAQGGFETMVNFGDNDSDLLKRNPSYDLNHQMESTTLGQSLLIGTALVSTALIGSQISKLAPLATIEKFKINYSRDTYNDLYSQLSLYSVKTQSSKNEHNFVLNKVATETIKTHKLDVHK